MLTMIFVATTGQPVSPLVAVLMMLWVVFLLGWALSGEYRTDRRRTATLRQLADRFGFAATPDLRVRCLPRSEIMEVLAWNLKPLNTGTEPGFEGVRKGRKLHFANVLSSAGKSTMTWGEVAMAVEAHGFQFVLRPENFDHRFLGLLGEHLVRTGDEAFDRNWAIETDAEEVLKAFFLPELRERLNAAAAGPRGVLILEGGWLRYKEAGGLEAASWMAAPEDRLDLLADLAEAIEVATRNYTPPPKPATGYGEGRERDDWGEKAPKYDDSP